MTNTKMPEAKVVKPVCLQLLAKFFALALTMTATANVIAENDGHPLIKAYEGSFIEGQEVKEYDLQRLVIGKVQTNGAVSTENIEGKVTRIDYRDPDNRSSLERFRNYEQALKGAGFKFVFSCAKDECGPEIQVETIGYYPPERYLTAVLKKKGGNVWVGIFVAAGPWTKIRIVEEKPIETGLVKVTAELMKANINNDGHMAVYGIYFDTGKSEVKPASAETIKEIASLLQKNTALKVYIVGHTDNVGKLKDNLELSNRRAAAVVKELIGAYRIDAGRLEAGGAGPLAPVASNDSKEGKDLNRRVEIVKK